MVTSFQLAQNRFKFAQNRFKFAIGAWNVFPTAKSTFELAFSWSEAQTHLLAAEATSARLRQILSLSLQKKGPVEVMSA